MSTFTSSRERRLWLWALAVVVAIYATLGLAGTLVAFLQENNLLVVTYVAGLILVLLAIVGSGLRRPPGRRELWVAAGIAAVYGLVVPRLGLSPVERTHLVEYGVLALLVYQALLERRENGRGVPAPAVMAVAITAFLGWIDEGIQALLPNRVYDMRDVGFNALAALMAVTASAALAWARQRLQT